MSLCVSANCKKRCVPDGGAAADRDDGRDQPDHSDADAELHEPVVGRGQEFALLLTRLWVDCGFLERVRFNSRKLPGSTGFPGRPLR